MVCQFVKSVSLTAVDHSPHMAACVDEVCSVRSIGCEPYQLEQAHAEGRLWRFGLMTHLLNIVLHLHLLIAAAVVRTFGNIAFGPGKLANSGARSK